MTARYLKIIEILVNARESMLRLRWQRIESLSLSSKIMTAVIKNSSSTKLSRGRSANRPISNNTRNSISNGTRICSKHKKKMLKLSQSLKSVTLLRLRATDKSSETSSHLLSNSALNFWTCSKSSRTWPSKRSRYFNYISIIRMFSKFLINLYRYQDAHEIQIRCQELEQEEREKYMKER